MTGIYDIENARQNLEKHLKDNPCRGIVLGMGKNGEFRQFSWIMGRSSNSQNRIYEVVRDADEDLLRTAAADPSKVKDPRLIIYNVMRAVGSDAIAHVVSNGDQTDTVVDYFKAEDALADLHATPSVMGFDTFKKALATRCCEPDAPTFTPRITGYQVAGANFAYIAVQRASEEARASWNKWVEDLKGEGITADKFSDADEFKRMVCMHSGLNANTFPTISEFFEYDMKPGFGWMVTTYMPGSKQLPSFSRAPLLVPIAGDTLEEGVLHFWDHLEPEWRVSAAGKEIAVDGTAKLATYNRFVKVQ